MPKSAGGVLLAGLNVERNTEVPLYKQLDASFRRLILNGSLLPGQKLPSTRELSNDLGVSRITIKSVYEQLIAEGYAKAKSGSGTYIAEGLDLENLPAIRPPKRYIKPLKLKPNQRCKTIQATMASIQHGATEPFRPGVPALDQFPFKTWHKYLLDASTSDAHHHMSYGEVHGNTNLRTAIAKHLADARGMHVDASQIVITCGAQAAFVRIAFVLLTQGDTVWYENPGHIAGRDVMQNMGAHVLPVPIDNEGLDLQFAIRNHSRPALIFSTPSHQQPLGTTMSLARRLALLNYAKQHNAWVVEDDYDSEFRYRGRPLPALGALDHEGRVIYVGTFSKSMCAAVRVGYMVVPHELVDAFAKAGTLLGNNASALVEQALYRFIEDGRFVEHVRKMRRIYRQRRDILFGCLKKYCAETLQPQVTDAGMHILAWLKNGIDERAAHKALLEAGIESLPLSVYCINPLERNAIILGFSGVPEERIPFLVKRMSKILKGVIV